MFEGGVNRCRRNVRFISFIRWKIEISELCPFAIECAWESSWNGLVTESENQKKMAMTSLFDGILERKIEVHTCGGFRVVQSNKERKKNVSWKSMTQAIRSLILFLVHEIANIDAEANYSRY